MQYQQGLPPAGGPTSTGSIPNAAKNTPASTPGQTSSSGTSASTTSPPPAPGNSTTPPTSSPTASKRPRLTSNFRGWYPRWWLLSALFCACLIALWSVLNAYVCTIDNTNAAICQVNSWTDWRQGAIVVILWLIFLLGWLVAYALGVGPIEVLRVRTPAVLFFDAISQYRPVYLFLYILGVFSLFATIISWMFNHFQPFNFSLYSILIFVASSCFFQRHPADERRIWIIGYGVFALVCLIFMLIWPLIFRVSRFQPVIFTSEIIIVAFGVITLVRTAIDAIRGRAPQKVQPASLNPEAALLKGVQNAMRPGAVLQELFLDILTRRNTAQGGSAGQPAPDPVSGSPGP